MRNSLVLFAALFSTPAFADFSCDKGMRPVTPVETQAVKRMLEAAKASLPAVPAGWMIEDETKIEVQKEICRDFDGYPWRATYSRTLHKTEGEKARTTELNKSIETEAAKMKANEAKSQARADKIQALSKKIAEAAQKGNMAEVERLQKELEPVTAELEAEGQAMDKRFKDIDNKAAKDTSIQVSIILNADGGVSSSDAKPVKINGAPVAFIREYEGKDDAQAELLLGAWKLDTAGGSGDYQLTKKNGAPSTATQSVHLFVHADKARAEGILRSVNLAPLNGLLAK